jgi:outer membrane protein insertion porin family
VGLIGSMRVLRLLSMWGLGVLCAAFFAASAHAAIINQIVVEGNQRVELETVESYLQLQRGDEYDAARADESIKVLFQTGLFSDVSISQRGNTLVVRVSENPLVNVVNFEGNTEIDDETLSKEVEVRERMIFTKPRAQADTRRILALYQAKGFYNVRVAPQLIRLADNRVNIVFEVTEGDETKIREIRFSGNNAFGAGTLHGVIATKEYSWWRIFGRASTYDPDRMEYDKELLRRYYLKHGFADVEIVGAGARLSEDGTFFVVDFSINEGPRYSINDVAIAVGQADLEPDDLKKVVKTGVGDTYDASRVDKTVENLTLEASRQGFVFARVEPKVERDPATNTVNLTYDISEGQRTYIERIDIIGNSRTYDEVIRRELRLFEGDAYNKILVERARRRLTALDFFEKIEFSERPGTAPDKVVLVVEVVEKSTGSLSFSVGYSSVETVVGSVEVAERNLFGRGQQVRLNTALSFKRQQVDFSFTEPYFMGLPVSAGFDLFATITDNRRFSSYKSEQIGGALRTGFRIDEFSNVNFKYYLAYRDIIDIDRATAAPAIISQEGESWKSSVSATYTWDDIDNPARPTSGLRAQLEAEIAGLGGTDQFVGVEGRMWYFLPLFDERVTVKFEANAGHLESLDSDVVPLQDRYFKGADSFRGFAKSGVGPKQIGNDGQLDSIGGTTYAIGTVEMIFPLGLPESFGLEGVVFSDFGTVFGAEENSVVAGVDGCTRARGCSVSDDTSIRASIGAGVLWQSPFGPLRLEAAYPIIREKYDEKEWFRFSVGTRF